jgi:hypothetical protein
MRQVPPLLLLLLTWASFGFAQSAPQPPASAHVWRQSKETNTADAYTYTRFTLVGKFSMSPHDAVASRPALVVDCIPGKGANHPKGKFLTANLLVGTALKVIYVEPEEIIGTSYYPKIAVQFHTDDASGETRENWSTGTEKTSAVIPKDALKKILRAHTLTISANDDHGSPVAMQFDLADPASVEQTCNVDER